MLTYHSDHMYDDVVGEHGISEESESRYAEFLQDVLKRVTGNIQSGKYGFVELTETRDLLGSVNAVYDQISWAEHLVVVGIGGSDLGGRTLQNSLQLLNSPMQVHFHGDTTDPTAIDELLRKIDMERTVFNIVSKSGGTMETMIQYLYFKNEYHNRTPDWQKHFIFTTDAKEGALRKEADTHGILTVDIPGDVGGRFSVLTSVGLLPAIAMGIDIEELLNGADGVVDEVITEGEKAIAFEISKEQMLLYEQGTKSVVIMPYANRLEEFGRWFRQLWAESLGKEGKGILPIQARGPADQHSQLQFYSDGTHLSSVLFLKVTDHGSSQVIERVDVEGLEYLEGQDLNEVVNVEQEATALALLKAGRPNATLEIERIDAQHLGALFMTFELAVTFLGEMLEINAFDQPGVEESKEMIYALLGRPGFEDKLREIEKLSKAN